MGHEWSIQCTTGMEFRIATEKYLAEQQKPYASHSLAILLACCRASSKMTSSSSSSRAALICACMGLVVFKIL